MLSLLLAFHLTFALFPDVCSMFIKILAKCYCLC